MTDYQYDIFISYRRMDDDWVRWTRENFSRPLRSLLLPGISNVSIFLDDQIETGASWPAHLANAHASSRLLIPILSRDYFQSEWCRLELALMHHREKQLGYRTPEKPYGLILPFIIDDGDCFPADVQEMQGKNIHDYANPCMCKVGPRQEEFAECLRIWCPCVEKALAKVPQFDPAWSGIAHEQFRETFRIAVGKQKTLPPLALHRLTQDPNPIR